MQLEKSKQPTMWDRGSKVSNYHSLLRATKLYCFSSHSSQQQQTAEYASIFSECKTKIT
jgi:hypothetical protein